MRLKEENKLDKNGEYIGDQSQTDEEAEAAIPAMASVAEDRPFHVAFAENRAFNIEYYKDEKYTEILFANQEYNEDENSEESENQTDKFIYDAKLGEKIYAKITKKDNAVYMSDADCPDKLCVHTGTIHKTGETIVCLPHRVVVEITGTTDTFDAVVQ